MNNLGEGLYGTLYLCWIVVEVIAIVDDQQDKGSKMALGISRAKCSEGACLIKNGPQHLNKDALRRDAFVTSARNRHRRDFIRIGLHWQCHTVPEQH